MSRRNNRRSGAVVVALATYLVLPVIGGVRAADDDLAARRAAVQARLDKLFAEINAQWRDHGQKTVTRVKVAPLAVKPCVPPPGFRIPASCTNVTVKDGIYYRAGRPAFLFGVEGRMYDGAWINRILGLDFFELHSAMVWWRGGAYVTESPGPRGGLELTVGYRDYPLAGLIAREALRGGSLFCLDYYHVKAGDHTLHWKKYAFDPPVLSGPRDYEQGTGHFINLCLENPDAFDYYVSSFRYVNRLMAPYPLLHQELINEVMYNSYWVDNVIAFQDAMRAKYGDIATANKVWHTSLASFDDLLPPYFLNPSVSPSWTPPMNGPPRTILWGNLLADWSGYMAAHGAEMFQRLRQAAEAVAPPGSHFTFQSPYIFGDYLLLPALKAQAETVYGAEHGFCPFAQGAPGQEDWAKVRALIGMQFALDLVRNAAPDKPIINLEASFAVHELRFINNFGLKGPGAPAGPNHMRMYYWAQAAHDVSGSVISYFYTDECSEGGYSVWDPRVMTRAAVRAIPRVQAEIRDLAEIVLPRPRIRGRLGLLYSFETAAEGAARRWFGRASLDTYAAAVLTRVPVDIVTAADVAAGRARDYPVLVITHAARFPREAFARLESYVENGGTLVVTGDALEYDEKVQPLGAERLLGATRTGPLPGRVGPCRIAAFDVGEVAPDPTLRGCRVTLNGAEALAGGGDQIPLTLHRRGKGRVYFVPWNLDPTAMRKLLAGVCAESGACPDIGLTVEDDGGTTYVETHLLGRPAEGRAVVYAVNFGGGPRRVRLTPEALAGMTGSYRVRDVQSGETVAPDGGRRAAVWSAADLAKGIPTSLPAQDPVLLLVEKANLPPTPLRGLSDEQKTVLAWAWRDSPPAKRRAVVQGSHVSEFRVSKPKMPTAVKTLEDAGWEVNSFTSPLLPELVTFSSRGHTNESLAGYQVLIQSGLQHGNYWKMEELQTLTNFVARGGGLLVCLKRDWHGDPLFYEQLQLFGVQEAAGQNPEKPGDPALPAFTGLIHDPPRGILGEPLYVGFAPATAHATTAGVKLFQTTGIRPLRVSNPRATALFAADAGAQAMGLHGQLRPAGGEPVAVALTYGQGRVAVIGSDTWLRPEEQEMGDNRRLLLNIMDWLEGRDAQAAAAMIRP